MMAHGGIKRKVIDCLIETIDHLFNVANISLRNPRVHGSSQICLVGTVKINAQICGTVKNNAQICLQVWQNEVCTGQESAHDYAAAEDRASVKGGVAAREALEGWSVFCYQPTMSSCTSRDFILMYFLPPHWVPAT